MAFFRAVGNLCNKFIENLKQKLNNNLSYYLKKKAKSQCPPKLDFADCRETVRTPWIISSLCQRGSIAVEASLLLPIFIFFFLHLISILQFLSCYSRIETALHQTGRKLSVYAYLYDSRETGIHNDMQPETEWAQKLFQAAYVKAETERRVLRDYLEHSPIIHGADGLYYRYCKLPDEEYCIDLTVVYEVRPMFAFPGVMNIGLVNRCRMRAWTGYQITENAEGEREQIVYVTEHGSVYHISTACTHLRLSVRRTPADSVSTLRNADGGKYYPCEICARQTGQGNLCYITDQGRRYHHSLSCSGLKRSVRAIPIWEAADLRACSRCG